MGDIGGRVEGIVEEQGSRNADQDCHSQHRTVLPRNMNAIEGYGLPRNIGYTDVDQFLMSLPQDVEPRVMKSFEVALFCFFDLNRQDNQHRLITHPFSTKCSEQTVVPFHKRKL